jgi:hypothetical protein
MITSPSSKIGLLGKRVARHARALLAVSALAALAVSTAQAAVVFTRTTTQDGEGWAQYSATFTPSYSGNYTLGFNITAGGPGGDNAILIDAVTVTTGATIVFADGFETPDLPNNRASYQETALGTGNWVCTSFSGILDGSPPNWGLSGPNQNLGFADGTRQYGFLQAYTTYRPSIKAASTLPLVAGQTYTVSFYQASRKDFGGIATYTVTLDAPPPAVYASGTSSVIGFDPIFLNGPVVPDYNESKPVPTVGYNDPRWTNPHAASVFPLGTHPWEDDVPYNFTANWINAWAGGGQLNTNPGLDSNRHGKTSSSPGWAGYPYYGVPDQSFTKYSTTVYGEGEFVLQFLADNVSWIYVDGALVGYQDYWWPTSGTGRYLISLTGAGAHDLGFVIWDGGGLAGGKFRLETRASFELSNPGVPLPPRAAAVTLSNLTHTYDGTPKSATVTTAPGGLTTSVTYNGSTTPPTNAGSYAVVATVTSAGYAGSATGTLTINKAPVSFTLGNLTQTYDGTAKSITVVSSTPSGVAYVINYLGNRTDAGSCPVLVVANNPNYTGSTSGTLAIAKANATVSVSGYTGTYDAAAHGATGSATGVGGASLGGLNLGATFTNAPGGTANWTFLGGTNYNDQNGSVAITIAKANATVVVTSYSVTYDAAPHAATVASITGVNGETGATVGSVTLNTTHTDAGTYSDSWTFTGGTNYNDIGATAITNTITKANATVSVDGFTGTYDGAAHGASGSAIGLNREDLRSGLSLGATFTNAPGGTANWTFSGGTNYNDQNGSVAIVINKANATVTVSSYNVTYDGQPHTTTVASLTGVNNETGATVGTVALPAPHTNAATYTDSWSFTGGTNYNNTAGTITNLIAKANATVVVAPYSVTYDGNAHSSTVTSITGVNSESGATVGAVTLNTTHTNAGTYTDSWSFTGGTNYKDIASTAITDTIAKANATVVVTPYNVEYDGVAHSATATITGVNGETGATVGTVALNTTHTTVGNYGDTWSFTGTANYNNIATTTIADKIKDTTAPAITATMTPRGGGDDESSQFFTLAFSATDLVGVKTLTAVLNGVTVTNGQVVQLQTIKSGAQSVKRDDGKLQIKATSFALVVTAIDAAGNTSTKTIVPVFVKNGKDDDDKKGDDKKGSDKKGSDSKGSDDKKGS